jgi:hypothetical protein
MHYVINPNKNEKYNVRKICDVELWSPLPQLARQQFWEKKHLLAFEISRQ